MYGVGKPFSLLLTALVCHCVVKRARVGASFEVVAAKEGVQNGDARE